MPSESQEVRAKWAQKILRDPVLQSESGVPVLQSELESAKQSLRDPALQQLRAKQAQ